MGRLQPSVVMPPNTVRRSDRAKKAKETVNKIIPELLRSSPRTRHGMHKAILITDPPLNNNISANSTDATIRIRLRNTDTLTAARQLTQYSRRASIAAGQPDKIPSKTKAVPNVCVLNMASPLRPGGGFLDGATSQEESLCMRTTLYPSLWDDFYRLPELGGVWTPDVLVFRDSTPDAEDLPKRERFFVDVISAGTIRFPETNTAAKMQRNGDEERIGCSCGVSYCDRDRELVTRKMRAVLRIAQSQGSEKLVLGAWGCGAYGNPVKEVAKIWRRVLLGTQRKAEHWAGIKEVVFAVPDRAQLKEFERCFADILAPTAEMSLPSPPPELSADASAQQDSSEQLAELVTKIQETEMQLDQITNPRSKARLRDVLDNLNKQLAQVGSPTSPDEDLPPVEGVEEEEENGFVTTGYMDDETGNSYYNFDSDDIASSGSLTPASLYEFRVKTNNGNLPQSQTSRRASVISMGDSPDTTVSTRYSVHSRHGSAGSAARQDDRLRLEEDGWFTGSINNLSKLMSLQTAPTGSPVLRSESMGNDVDIHDLALDVDKHMHKFGTQDN